MLRRFAWMVCGVALVGAAHAAPDPNGGNPLLAPDWARNDVQRVLDTGLFEGRPQQGLKGAPAPITRYESAVVSVRLYEDYIQGKGFEDVATLTDFRAMDQQVMGDFQKAGTDLQQLAQEVKELRATAYKLREREPQAMAPVKKSGGRWSPVQRLAFAPEVFLPADGALDQGLGWTVDYSLAPRNKPGFVIGGGMMRGLSVASTGDEFDMDRLSLGYLFKSRTQRGLNYGIGVDYLNVLLATPGANYTDTVFGYHARVLWPIGKRLLTEARYQQAEVDQLAPGRVTPDASGTSFRLWYLLGY